jgi:hypothetical protein
MMRKIVWTGSVYGWSIVTMHELNQCFANPTTFALRHCCPLAMHRVVTVFRAGQGSLWFFSRFRFYHQIVFVVGRLHGRYKAMKCGFLVVV